MSPRRSLVSYGTNSVGADLLRHQEEHGTFTEEDVDDLAGLCGGRVRLVGV